jgi:hypothetical protein
MAGIFKPVVEKIDLSESTGSFARLRIADINVLDIFAAKKVATGLEALLVEVDSEVLSEIDDWPQSEGFQMDVDPVEGGPQPRSRLSLQLSEGRFRDVFLALCEDVCSVMAEASESHEGIRVLYRRLSRWQAFLKRNRPEGLSSEAQAGLFGELLVFRDLFLCHLGPLAATRAWRGYTKANQDFQFTGIALEVKTTRATIPDRIHISNIQQLDDEDMEQMFLTVVSVHENETVGETLPEIIESLRRSLTDPERGLFDEGLIEVGYLDEQKHLYERTRYQRKDVFHFEVRDGFPRLARSQLPTGVQSVKYQISIAACRPFETEEKSVLSAVQAHLREVNNA